MKAFLKSVSKFLLIGSIPVFFIIIGYVFFDPFKVLRSYSDYSYTPVVGNRDHISTEIFMRNNRRRQYNAFIFGSSRALGFTLKNWEKLIPGTRTYLFNASEESIFGIYTKIKFLDSIGSKIDHAILVFDTDVTFARSVNSSSHLFIKDPRTSGESALAFQWTFFKAYFNWDFISVYYRYLVTNNVTPKMRSIIQDNGIQMDTLTNEMRFIKEEKSIWRNEDNYYKEKAQVFYERSGESIDSSITINKIQVQMMNEIKRILIRQGTKYKVILSPLYDQKKFNAKNLGILQSVFQNNLYDFTGKNGFTELKTNYYESSHFRPTVGDSILKLIYP